LIGVDDMEKSEKYFAVLSAGDPSEYAREDYCTVRSLFSAHVWDGLTGKAAGSNGLVTPATLAEFVAKTLAEDQGGRQGRKEPYFSSKGSQAPAVARAERCILPVTGKRSAVCIGISSYRDSSIYASPYAASDGQNIFNVLTSGPAALFEKPLSFLYSDGQATRKSIYDAVFNLRYVLVPGDVLVMYFAGNTCLGRDGLPVLLCHDTEMKNYEFTGLGLGKLQEIFDSLPCDVVMLMDSNRIACIGGR
jgi:hypothetical protein